MKAIIENGKINGGIQSCFIAEYGVGVVFNRYLMRYINQDDGAPTLT